MRGIQYAAASRSSTSASGILDRPVKPGDDRKQLAAVVFPFLRIGPVRYDFLKRSPCARRQGGHIVSELRIAIVGFGKIARTQHVPAIAATEGATLVAIADPNAAPAGVPHFPGLKALLRDGPEFDAVALCTPPDLADAAGLQIGAIFDFRQAGPHSWDIRFETDQGPVTLSSGGARLIDGDRVLVDAKDQEYPRLYRRFVDLASHEHSDVDLAPFQLVADAFLLGRWRIVEPFEDQA